MSPSHRALALLKNFLFYFAIFSLLFEQFALAALPINPDGTTNTQVTKTASGIDQINIAAPDSAGLSHNRYSDYNVNTPGQVVNNFSGSASDLVSTNIGGLVTANPNLSDSGSARVILNEVTSTNISRLLGYVEIAGSKADLILANPNGFTCNGCGFINTAHLMMVAGSSDFDASRNLGFNLKEQLPGIYIPLITVEGLGLDVSSVSSVDIIASSVKLVSSIRGSDDGSVTIKTGEGRYNYDSKEISSLTTDDRRLSTDPLFAIDASALAKIQAGQIYLIATKEGVGVKMESEILASSVINIAANGDVYYSNLKSGDSANLKASGTIQSINSGSSISAPILDIQANRLNNLGNILANNLTIKNSGELNNFGDISALNLNLTNINNINNYNNIYGQDFLAISGENLNNAGKIYSRQSYAIMLSGLLTNSALITSKKDLIVNSNQLTNNSEISALNDLNFLIAVSATNSGNLIANNNLNFTANSLTNSGAIESGGDSAFNLVSLINSTGSSIYSNNALNLNLASSLNNLGKISAQNNLNITGSAAITNSNQILTNADLNISAASLDNSGLLASLKKSLTFNLTSDLENSGEIATADAFNIAATSLNNRGIISAQNNFTINVASLNNNAGALLASLNQALTLNSNSLNNSGVIFAKTNFTLSLEDFTNLGDLVADGDLTVTRSNNFNNSGAINSSGDLNLNAVSLINSGEIFSNTDFTLVSTSLENSGVIKAFGKSEIATNIFNNKTDALIFSDLDLAITANTTLTNSGSIFGNSKLVINSGTLTNNSEIFAIDDLTFNLTNILTNSGELSSLNNLTINSTSSITNSNQILSDNNLNITATDLTNYKEIKSNDNLTINAASLTNSASSLILAENNLTINSNSITNQNTKPTISSLITSGLVAKSGNVFLTTNNLNNKSGIIAGKSTSLSALSAPSVTLINDSGAFISTAAISLTLGALDYNITGTVTASNIDITASNITNSGNVTATDYIKLNATSGNITNGLVSGDNSAIQLAAGSYIDFTASNNINNYATIIGTTNTTLTSTNGNINNYATGKIQGGSGTTTISAINGAFNNLSATSTFTANNNAIFNVRDLNNFGEISVQNDLTTNVTHDLTNNASALIWSNHDATFYVANNFTNYALAEIYADRNLTIQKNSAGEKTASVKNISGNIETFSGDISIVTNNLTNQKTTHRYQGPETHTFHNDYCIGSSCYWYDEFTSLVLGVDSPSSNITSGNQLNINAYNFTNDASNIISSANLSINFSSSPFNNHSYNLANYVRYIADCCAGMVSRSPSEIYTASIKSGGSLTITQDGTSKASLINGGDVAQYVSITSPSSENHSTTINHIDSYALATSGILDIDLSLITRAISDSSAASTSAPDAGEVSATITSRSTTPTTITTTPTAATTPTTIFSGNYKINLDPAATTPLVESRSQFTDKTKFFGSVDYFNALGLDGRAVIADIERQTRTTTRMLGDSYVESHLILDQIKTLTNDSIFISQTTIDPEAQVAELLNNAATELTRLGLNAEEVAIHGLTTAQIKSLTKDIITFETATVNGIQVLAPKIYLSEGTRERLLTPNTTTGSTPLANSSTIFGKSGITINAPNTDLINNGSIASGANNNINLTLASLTNKVHSINQAQIISGNNLNITATNNIKNIGANIAAINNINLTILRGSIINSSLIQTNDSNLLSGNLGIIGTGDSYILGVNDTARSSGNIHSELLQTATIKGGSIAIDAANDFTNLAAEISATRNILSDSSLSSGDLNITAGNNLNIETLKLHNRSETSWGSKKRGGSTIINTVTNLGSNIDAAGNIALITTGTAIGTSFTDESDTLSSLNIIGSNVNSTEDTTIIVRDNVNIVSAINTYHKEEYNHKKTSGAKSTSTSINDTTTNISSGITSGGDLSITSGGDTNIIASNLTATGSGNILAGEYLDLKSTSSAYGAIVSNDAANVNILNGIDTKYSYLQTTKTKIGFSLENAAMTAAMMVAIAAAGPLSAGMVAAAGVGGAAVGSVNKQTTKNTSISYDETVISSNLNFGNDLTISSLNDTTLKAAKLNADDDLTLNAGNNLLIKTASEAHSKSYENNNHGNYFFSNGSSGYSNGNVKNTEITSNGETNINMGFNVANLTLAEYNKSSGDNIMSVTTTGIDGSILYGDFSTNPQLAYLQKLDPSNTLYNPIEETNKNWDQTNRGLTEAGQAVVAITATALTMGVMSPVNGSWLQGGLVAGASATMSTASIAATNSAMNADGDIFKQLKTISKDTWDTTTSKESIKNIIIAAAASGLTVGATNYLNTGSFTTPANAATNTVSANASWTERVGTNLQTSFQDVATQTVASSAAQSAVNGDSFTDSLKNQATNVLIYTAAKVVANEIGRAYHGTETTLTDSNGNPLTNVDGSVMTAPQISKPTQLVLHAGLGCAIAAVSGGDCGSGAVAGVVGESVAEGGNKYGGIDRQTSIQLANAFGAISAGTYGNLTGQSDEKNAENIWNGSRIGQNAAENNAVKIWVQEVAAGNYHTSIKIEPEDQQKWLNDPKYGKVFNNYDPETGKYYATIGGGPDTASLRTIATEGLGNLIGGETIDGKLDGINRTKDIRLDNKESWQSENLTSINQENNYIKSLFETNANYKNNLDYDLFPTRNSSSYNSNSYAAGLLQAVGTTPPKLPTITVQLTWQDVEYPEKFGSIKTQYVLPRFPTPGYDKPVPSIYFGVQR